MGFCSWLRLNEQREGIPLTFASYFRGLVWAALLLFASQAQAQRVQFPTAIGSESPFRNTTAPTASLDGTVQTTQPWDPYSDQGYQSPAVSGFPATSPYGSSPYGSTYAAPSQSPYGTPLELPYDDYAQPLPDGTLPQRTRLLNDLHFEDTFLSRFGDRGFGVNDANTSASFAFPFLYNPAPIYLTPGFTFHSWDGPNSAAFPGSPDLPARAYDAYLDASWHPHLTTWFSADLAVRVGVYSDFDRINSDSIRTLGRGVGIFTLSPQWQVAAGVWYIDRLTVKLLPAGGVIWTPNQDTRFAFLFPNPKLSQRWTTIGNTDVWVYLAGEYGGGKWTVQRALGGSDVIELNDLRALLGIEWFRYQGVRGNFEVGYVFDRHIIYRNGTPDIKPSDTFLLRAGLSY